MGCTLKISIAVAVVAYVAYRWLISSLETLETPKLNEDEWWGPGNSIQQNRGVIPFKINISNAELNDLNERLKKFLERPHIPPLENQGFQYGFNSNFLKQIVKYWLDEYDWRKREVYLNQFTQFKTNINGLDIHFVKASPKKTTVKRILPIVLLHGWPGSIREFYEVIPFLNSQQEDKDFVFEVIVPSLPGYGFSQGAVKPGFGPPQIAIIIKKLMIRLKFEKFYVAGGDWGSLIGKHLAQLYPDNVLGFHSTMCMVNTPSSNIKWFLGSIYPPLVVEKQFQHKMYPFSSVLLDLFKEMGYMILQATRPDTIGTALSDTPAGLAGYILEKFSVWTNRGWKDLPDGGLTKKYSVESLLDNIMIYWFTNSITTSQRLYSEAFTFQNILLDRLPVTVPTACARFENELVWQPTNFLREQYRNLIQVSDIENGGHFGAFEEPNKFSKDVWSAIKKFEDFHRNTPKPKTI